MKTIYKVLAIIFILITTHSCEEDRQVDLISSFPFEVRADFDAETFVNVPIDVILDLQPEFIVTTNIYTVSYRVLEGKANLNLDADTKEKLVQGESYVVEDLRFKTSITPISAGAIQVELTFSDQEGMTTVKTINFNSSDTNFTVSAKGSLASMIVGERLQISYDIEEQGKTSVDDYTLVFSSSKNGVLTVNSQDYLAGEKIKIPSLNFIAYYTPSVAGEHEISNTITATSNRQSQPTDVKVEVEGSSFEFNVTAPIEVAIGKTIDLNFAIDELVGDSKFDTSFAVTGVNGEFRDANNVVLIANRDYDVENTFNWTLKGVEQGTMDITFTVKNQFGVEEIKTISVEAVPVEFDFNVEIVGTVFDLGKPIPIQFLMDAPSSLSYTLSFSANTDGVFDINGSNLNEGSSTSIPKTNFIANYIASLSGNSVLNLTITASNGVVKTQQINFQVQQKPVVKSIELIQDIFIGGGGSDCGRFDSRREITLTWAKAPNTTIVAANVTVNGELITTNFAPFISADNNELQIIHTSCMRNAERNFEIIATITDSNGLVSAPLKNNINF